LAFNYRQCAPGRQQHLYLTYIAKGVRAAIFLTKEFGVGEDSHYSYQLSISSLTCFMRRYIARDASACACVLF